MISTPSRHGLAIRFVVHLWMPALLDCSSLSVGHQAHGPPVRAAPSALLADDACVVPGDGDAASCSLHALQGYMQLQGPRVLSGASSRAAAEVRGRSSAIDSGTRDAPPLNAGTSQGSGSPAGQGLRLIGAALPKTGTSSIALALEDLGFHPQHGEFLVLRMWDDMWVDWQRGNATPAVQAALQRGFDATLDIPFCWIYKELMERYPDAKVLLTGHPGGPEGWVRSLEEWVKPGVSPNLADPLVILDRATRASPGQTLVRRLYLQELDCDIEKPFTAASRRACKQGYIRWQDDVRRTVPPGQLLEFNVSAGWQGLCALLGAADCPRRPFPNVDVVTEAVGSAVASVLRHKDVFHGLQLPARSGASRPDDPDEAVRPGQGTPP